MMDEQPVPMFGDQRHWKCPDCGELCYCTQPDTPHVRCGKPKKIEQ